LLAAGLFLMVVGLGATVADDSALSEPRAAACPMFFAPQNAQRPRLEPRALHTLN